MSIKPEDNPIRVNQEALQKATESLSASLSMAVTQAEQRLLGSIDEKIKNAAPRESLIKIARGSVRSEISGVAHPMLQEVLDVLSVNEIPLLVGPAGCGKSWLAEQAALVLGASFSFLSCSGGVTEGRIFGKTVPNVTTGEDVYRPSNWVIHYESTKEPSLYLFDEFDALDENVAVSVNAALAGGSLDVPDIERPRRFRWKNKDGQYIHHIIATANTYCRGSDRVYTGRNQMDGATIDRFFPIPMDYDREIERSIAASYGSSDEILQKFWGYRETVSRLSLERFVSTRWIQRACKMKALGWTVQRIEDRFFAGWSADEVRQVRT